MTRITSNDIIEERIKKSELVAKDAYDYQLLSYPHRNLLSLTIQAQNEELILQYEVIGKRIDAIWSEDVLTKYLILSAIGTLKELSNQYDIALEPANLYYDCYCNIRVKKRDQYGKGSKFNEANMLMQYKAIVGSSLQKKYSYDDIIRGGSTLLKKNRICNDIYAMNTVEEIQEYFTNLYEHTKREREHSEILMSIKTVKRYRWSVILLAILTVMSSISIIYYAFVRVPYSSAVIELNNSFMESDYISCIDAMNDITIDRMDQYQKYMLAISYIRSENLTQEQKENILAAITLRSMDTTMEYWIYLGRNNTELAIDIALELSDNQLLLYAYMKEKDNIQNDTSLTGTEKSEQIEAIEAQMQPLIEEYIIEDNE